MQNKMGAEYRELVRSPKAADLEDWLRTNDCDIRALIASSAFNEKCGMSRHMIVTKTLALHLKFWQNAQLCPRLAPGQTLPPNSRNQY